MPSPGQPLVSSNHFYNMLMTSSLAIDVDGLRKKFGQKVAVADLTLQVARGEVFGFLGPNGAGKTTSVKILLGLVEPNAGGGRLLGHALGDPRSRERVGFLPEHFRCHEWLTAVEFLRVHADLYRISVDRRDRKISELLDRVGLTDHAKKRLSAFSKGMLQRIGLAQALLNEPDLVILDEPTSGLDPNGRRLVRDIIADLRRAGSSVFLNSHLLSEVEITCDRVAFIKQGEVVRVGPMNMLKEGSINVEIRHGGLSERIGAGLGQWGRIIESQDGVTRLAVEDTHVLPSINRYLVEQGVDVFALSPQRLSLEELFIQIVGREEGL